jgi:ubiquinone/menaquinone biosynthesis C-methylase UbiE
MTTVTSDSIADTDRPATVPQTHGRLQNAWGRGFAAIYEPLMRATENGGNAKRRAAVLARARGTVVELSAGTGLNLPHYPTDIELVLTEPEQPMARRLLERLQRSGRQARVVQAPAERIPLPDGCADTVVSTLVLCTVHDLDATLTEIRRLLRPDGRLLFIEHVAAEPGTRLRRWQDRLERPWRRFAHGCHTNRDTEKALRNAGYALETIHRGQMEGEPLLRPLTWGTANVAAA